MTRLQYLVIIIPSDAGAYRSVEFGGLHDTAEAAENSYKERKGDAPGTVYTWTEVEVRV